MFLIAYGRSRKGAWIEINRIDVNVIPQTVAPVRERGLKSQTSGTTDVSPQVAPVRERGLKSS